MVELVWLIPALPLIGFLILLLVGSRIGEPRAGWVATTAAAGSFLAAVVVLAGLLGKDAHSGDRSYELVLFQWLPSGSLKVEAGFLVDPLSITMALFVTGVGALIHLYSIGYMHGDPKYSKFFLYLNLFLFSMLMLVFGNNLVVTFLGWEGVGACSYFLISFWHRRESAATAGKKAFVTNRVGDWGFMVATFAIWSALGTVTYTEIASSPAMSAAAGTAVSLLLFVAAAGKSAQLPLYVWLPDAMEGPTPVSAMVHAATMVTSGVYLLVRMNGLLTDDALLVIAVIGAATALFAALSAVAQHDIKKVLAYSTISQLGFMFLAIGSGAYVAAIFHVITHAFFKALLFLGSGSVIHGMHDEQDMRKMGALRALMPITAGTFIVGWLAIAGVPPFSGFWSKDEILLAAWEQKNIGPLLWFVGLVTALLTAYYMTRQVILVFFGEQRWDEDVHPHESSWTMTLPLCLLAGAAIVGGGINLPLVKEWLVLEHFLEPIFAHPHHFSSGTSTKVVLAVISVVIGVSGITIATLAWLFRRIPTEQLEPEFLENAMYVDSTY
ncbi:MAG TPA: NADH-quinone oxidoreductase subunit L, partial [Acidimicrobiaceae bacterium]|nr:NADH-quinone oxidoreductase subunit L [Acidimicrobiaceae bacterium]